MKLCAPVRKSAKTPHTCQASMVMFFKQARVLLLSRQASKRPDKWHDVPEQHADISKSPHCMAKWSTMTAQLHAQDVQAMQPHKCKHSAHPQSKQASKCVALSVSAMINISRWQTLHGRAMRNDSAAACPEQQMCAALVHMHSHIL